MPFYHITHSTPLSSTQRQSLATSITHLHSTTFNAPSLFVNLKFSPSSSAPDDTYFVAGKPKPPRNVIFAYVRGGGSRSKEAFDKLAKDIEALWDETVGEKGTLQACFVVPGLVARERGLAIPDVGGEGKWMNENWGDFQKRAKEGDEDFKGLVEEVGRRPELRR